MSSVIHMDTEETRSVAQKLDQTSFDIHQMIAAFGNSLRALNWQGGGRDEFVNDFQSLEKQFLAEADRGALLSLRIKREVEEWLEADNGFLRQEIGSVAPQISLSSPVPSEEEGKPYKWYKIPKAILKFVSKVIKNKEIAKKIPLLGLIMGAGEDIAEGDTSIHAVLSESLEALINLSPVGLWGFILAGGQLFSAGAEGLGYHKTAVTIQDIAGKADIVDHLSDAIADFYIHHPAYLLIAGNPVGQLFLAPEMQELSFGFWSQEFHSWGLHDQANWLQNTGSVFVKGMREWSPINVFNNFFGGN